jgi:ribosomal protein L14E/L6E/L27E
MDIAKADIVISTAGRDQGELFYVVSTENGFAFLANGKGRKIESPKRKKLKHVRRVTRTDSRVAQKLLQGDTVLNSELRRDLASISQQFNSQNQGG